MHRTTSKFAEPDHTISREHELAAVMSEIVEAFQGAGAALTVHPEARPAEMVHSVGSSDVSAVVGSLAATGSLDWHAKHPDDHRWVGGDLGRYAAGALALPVRQVAGHSRLVITVLFDSLNAAEKAAAEAVYMRRRPFAVGYFRLWQQERLQSREMDALRSALDLVDLAVMLIAKSGALTYANKAGRKLLDARNGLYEQQGELRASHRADSIVLQVSIDHVLASSENPDGVKRVPLFTVSRDAKGPLIMSVLPASSPVTEPGEVAAMVFAVDPDTDIRELAAPVCRVFGLTRVETDLACELALGKSLQDAATSLRLGEQTARSYLRVIFSKTGVNRQIDLIRLILASLVHASNGQEYEIISRDKSGRPNRTST